MTINMKRILKKNKTAIFRRLKDYAMMTKYKEKLNGTVILLTCLRT